MEAEQHMVLLYILWSLRLTETRTTFKQIYNADRLSLIANFFIEIKPKHRSLNTSDKAHKEQKESFVKKNPKKQNTTKQNQNTIMAL